MSPCTIWTNNFNAQLSRLYQPALEGLCFGVDQPMLAMSASLDCQPQPCLDQDGGGYHNSNVPGRPMGESIGHAMNSLNSSDGFPSAFEPIGTIAKQERGKFPGTSDTQVRRKS